MSEGVTGKLEISGAKIAVEIQLGPFAGFSKVIEGSLKSSIENALINKAA